MKLCPYCKEMVPSNMIRCKYCCELLTNVEQIKQDSADELVIKSTPNRLSFFEYDFVKDGDNIVLIGDNGGNGMGAGFYVIILESKNNILPL